MSGSECINHKFLNSISNMVLLAEIIAHRIHLDALSKRVIASHRSLISPCRCTVQLQAQVHLLVSSKLASTNIDETSDQKLHYCCQV